MSVIKVARIAPQDLSAFQVSAAKTSVAYALQSAMMAQGSPATLSIVSGLNVPNLLQVTITQPSMADQFAWPGDWILATDATFDEESGEWTVAPTTQIIVYGIGTGQTGNAVDFVNTFTANTPLVWAATTTPPAATANADGTVTLKFPQPTSVDGPFTYTAAGPGTVGEFTTDATGNVTATVSGLSGDTLGPWTVTVATQYQGVGATSLPSNTITLGPPPDNGA